VQVSYPRRFSVGGDSDRQQRVTSQVMAASGPDDVWDKVHAISLCRSSPKRLMQNQQRLTMVGFMLCVRNSVIEQLGAGTSGAAHQMSSLENARRTTRNWSVRSRTPFAVAQVSIPPLPEHSAHAPLALHGPPTACRGRPLRKG